MISLLHETDSDECCRRNKIYACAYLGCDFRTAQKGNLKTHVNNRQYVLGFSIWIQLFDTSFAASSCTQSADIATSVAKMVDR